MRAMRLWGHTLFLASKMDHRICADVMTKLANGEAINVPLQSLNQLELQDSVQLSNPLKDELEVHGHSE